MKKLLTLALMLLLIFPVLTGCMEAPPAGAEAKDVTLKLVARRCNDKNEQAAQEKAVSAYIASFTSAYPGIKVTVSYEKDIPASLARYDAALMCCDDSLEYVSKQALDISSYCGNNADYKSILPAAAALGEYNGGQYYLPFNYDRAVIYADKAAFADIKIPLPSNDWTYEQFVALLSDITNASGSKRYVGAYIPYYMPYVWKVVTRGAGDGWANDGKLLLNTGKTSEAFSGLMSVLEGGYAASRNFEVKGSHVRVCALSWTYALKPQDNGNHVISENEKERNPGTNAENLLAEGNLYMLPLPTFSGKHYGVSNTSSTYGFIVSRISQYPAEAAALALYSQSQAGQEALISYYRGVPSNTSLHGSDFWRRGLLSCENSDVILVGIDGDERDDYADILPFDENLYSDNIRLRTIISKYLINDITYKNSDGYYDAALKNLAKWFDSVTK